MYTVSNNYYKMYLYLSQTIWFGCPLTAHFAYNGLVSYSCIHTFKLLDPWSIVKTPKPSPPTEQLWVWTGESGSTLSGSTTVTSPMTSPTAALLLTYIPYTEIYFFWTASFIMISALIWLYTVKLIHKEVLLTWSYFQLFITKFLYIHMRKC